MLLYLIISHIQRSQVRLVHYGSLFWRGQRPHTHTPVNRTYTTAVSRNRERKHNSPLFFRKNMKNFGHKLKLAFAPQAIDDDDQKVIVFKHNRLSCSRRRGRIHQFHALKSSCSKQSALHIVLKANRALRIRQIESSDRIYLIRGGNFHF